MTMSLWLDRRRAGETREVDVVVVGAGIAGISLAWWLRGSGLKVALLDRQGPCAGASGRNAGFLTSGSVAHFQRQARHFGTEAAIALRGWTLESIAGLVGALEQGGIDALRRPCRALSMARTPQMADELGEAAEAMREAGFEVDDADPERPGLTGYLRAWSIPGEGQLDPTLAIGGLLEASGALRAFGEPALGIEPDGDGLAVETATCRWRAAHVVLAAGSVAPALCPWLEPRIVPRRGQALATTPVAAFLDEIVYGVEDWAYFRQLPDGRVVLGGRRILDPDGELGAEDRLNPIIQAALSDYLRQHIPGAAGATVTHRWSGPLGYTADDLPLCGAIPGQPGLWCLGGYSGHGMAWGFITAGWVASALTGGQGPPALVDPARFEVAGA